MADLGYRYTANYNNRAFHMLATIYKLNAKLGKTYTSKAIAALSLLERLKAYNIRSV